jgi:ATP-binding cassette, subfamily B, bacterial RamB/AmfA
VTRPALVVPRGGMLARRVVLGNLRHHPRDAALLALWSLVEAIPALSSGWAVAEATGSFLTGRLAEGFGWLGLLAAAALTGGAAARKAIVKLGALVEPLRDDLVSSIVTGALTRSLVPGWQPDNDAVARITHQAEIARDAYGGVLNIARTLIFTLGSALAGLLTLAPATLPFILPPLLGALLALRLMLPPLASRQRACVVAEEAIARSTASAFQGLRDITACGAEDQILSHVTAHVTAQAAAARSASRIAAARTLCTETGGWLPLLLVLSIAPALLRHGLTPARLIGAITYLGGSLRSALNTVGQAATGNAVRFTVTLQRIAETSPLSPSPARPSAAAPGTPAPASPPGTAESLKTPLPAITSACAAEGHLALRNAHFKYGDGAEPIIQDLSFEIPPGDHLAIIGPSGIGKSSLANLLAGLAQPTTGHVLVDGIPTARLSAASLASHRVLIPQEAYVFAGTLAENLSYLTMEYRQADMDAAVQAVGLLPLLSRVGGYRSLINPAALSAGERQLIALARAYLAPAPVVILDEATSQLDPTSEAQAEQAFMARAGTLVVIAHRISSALRARRILLLDGIHTKAGTHASLLDSSAMYQNLIGYWNGVPARTDMHDSRR